MSRSRSWCFTLNNYTQDEEIAVQGLDCVYLVYGREVGSDEHTPHLQGFIHMKSQHTLSAMKKRITRAHFEVRKGTVDEATDYCKKDGDFFERREAFKCGRKRRKAVMVKNVVGV